MLMAMYIHGQQVKMNRIRNNENFTLYFYKIVYGARLAAKHQLQTDTALIQIVIGIIIGVKVSFNHCNHVTSRVNHLYILLFIHD